MASRCSDYWRRLNPTYEHRLLDESSAAKLSPAFAALIGRNLDFALMADVLRLDLLSRYGGVWADVTTCPVQPLDSYVPKMTADVGFFAMPNRDSLIQAEKRSVRSTGAATLLSTCRPCAGRVRRGRSDRSGEGQMGRSAMWRAG